MAYASHISVLAPRMQTNAAWTSPDITFYTGNPRVAVDTGGWTIEGVARGAHNRRIELTTDNNRIAIVSATVLRIELSVDDMKSLGPGAVEIELLRLVPDPVRPLLRLRGANYPGIA